MSNWLPFKRAALYNSRAFKALCRSGQLAERSGDASMSVSKPQPLVDINPAKLQLRWQCRVWGAIFLIAYALVGSHAALSALAGAGIAVLGQAYFVLRAFSHAGATSAQQIVKGFYRGEAGKFMLTALLFATVFIAFKQVDVRWLFASFVLEQLVAWVVPLTTRATQP